MKKLIRLLISVTIIVSVLSGCKEADTDVYTDEPTIIDESTENPSDDAGSNDADVVVEEGRGQLVITSIDDIDAVIAEMTLDEKAGQLLQAERGGIQLYEISDQNIGSILAGGGSVPTDYDLEDWVEMYNRMQRVSRNSSTGLPIVFGIDAVHGHNNLTGATIFPHNIGLGAANNLELVERIGVATGQEMNATAMNWNFAPAVSVVQDIRWGRSYESFSEDGQRVAALGAAYITGLQSTGILSTTKHFIGDGYTEFGTTPGDYMIDRGDVTVSLEQLLQVYGPAYEAAIAAGTKSIMISFNSIAGEKMHGHDYLIQDVLRGEMGFTGMIVSDWEAIAELPGSLENQVADAINAGVDMLMQPYNWLDVKNAIISNVENNIISEERLDEAVRYVLVFKYEAGLFAEDFEKTAGSVGTDEARAVARQAVSESLVLLKNDGNLLPLDKTMNIFLTGPASDSVGVQCGGWTSTWQGVMDADLPGGTSLKDAFEIALQDSDGSLVDSAAEADVVVVAIGEMPYAEGMGDTADLSLSGKMALEGNVEALEAARASGKPVVVVMIAGRPRLVDEYIHQWDSFVMAWLPGTEGAGMTDVLFGDMPFTGTLPVTWPMTNEQASASINMENYDADMYQFEYDFGLTYE